MTSAGSIGHDGGPAQGRGGSGGRGVHYSELPALFTITPGGGLDPTAVSLPTVRAVRLAVVSKDGRGHRIAVRMPLGLRGVTVAAHGRAAAVISGVRPGRYVVDVDGLARGVILVG
jgi:hypothetical protein